MLYIYYVLCAIVFNMTFVFFFQTSMPLLGEDVDTDAEAEEVLNELNLLTEIEESPPGSIHLEMNSSEWSNILSYILDLYQMYFILKYLFTYLFTYWYLFT